MLILLSPAKTQNFETQYPQYDATQPPAAGETALLITELKKLTVPRIAKLMGVSEKIALLNAQRFKAFDPTRYDRNNAKQALFALQGDAYRALDANTLKAADINFLQQHLVILSGLYGYLRPLDLIQPYRLEMSTKLTNPRGKDLYAFWGEHIKQGLTNLQQQHRDKTIINLASNEYFKAVTPSNLPILTITFKEKKGKEYRVIGINAKRARGAMTRYIATHRITDPQPLMQFDVDGYAFNSSMSSNHEWVFTR